jgi:transcriptional regulator with XRE-family HTH domain
MIIGDRLRALRKEKKLSQGEIEERTGLLRCYISRVENGHTVPAVETLEKFARALEVPMYQLFHDGKNPPQVSNLSNRKTGTDIEWGSKSKDARLIAQFCRLFSRMDKKDLNMVMFGHGRWRRELFETNVQRIQLQWNTSRVTLACVLPHTSGTAQKPLQSQTHRRLREL